MRFWVERKNVLLNEIFKSLNNHNFSSNRSKTLGLVLFDSIFLVFYWLKFPAQSAERSLRKMDLKNDNRKKILTNLMILYMLTAYITRTLLIGVYSATLWSTDGWFVSSIGDQFVCLSINWLTYQLGEFILRFQLIFASSVRAHKHFCYHRLCRGLS